jgi:TolB-like protein/Flp pilus assembly protein TadD
MSRSLFAELRRRNVFRAAILYIGAVWALAQGIAQLSPVVGAPEWVARWFLVAAAIGFPFWIAFAWFYEFTPEGLKRESEIDPADSIAAHSGTRLDRWIFVIMGVAIVLLLTDRFVLRRGVNQEADFAVSEKSIAVLPFVNMSSDKEQEYFSDGISEELLNLLAKITPLHVAARTSSFSFKGQNLEIPEIARRLHVANVLEGSVRKAGDQIRITAQLIRASDGYHVWSETWDRKLDDIFRIQDEIAGKVVDQLKVTLLGEAPKVRTTDPKAYALYLQAIQLARQNTAEAYAKAEDLYHQVLAIDPRYAPAWSGLAMTFTWRVGIGAISSQEGFARAREAIVKSLEIDPEYAAAHAQLAYIAIYGDNDPPAAAKHLERALSLDPADLEILRRAALLLSNLGRLDQALAIDAAIVRRDPVNVVALDMLAYYQRIAGRYDEAIASFRTVLSLSPGWSGAHYELGVTLLLKGDAHAALAEIEQETTEAGRLLGRSMAYHTLGRKAESDQALAAFIEKYGKNAAYSVASDYAFRGEADETFIWLDKALQYRDSGLAEIVAENIFTNIRSDPRWLPFLRKIGKAPEQLAKIEFNVTLPKEWQTDAGAQAVARLPQAN